MGSVDSVEQDLVDLADIAVSVDLADIAVKVASVDIAVKVASVDIVDSEKVDIQDIAV